jgi:hypothetical protein
MNVSAEAFGTCARCVKRRERKVRKERKERKEIEGLPMVVVVEGLNILGGGGAMQSPMCPGIKLRFLTPSICPDATELLIIEE